jgi:hypothetical protein
MIGRVPQIAILKLRKRFHPTQGFSLFWPLFSESPPHTVRNFPEKLHLTKVGQGFSLYLLSLPKITTERFATIGPFSGELELSTGWETSKLQLTDFPKTGELQLHIWEKTGKLQLHILQKPITYSSPLFKPQPPRATARRTHLLHSR